jgi:hypothetical protein
MYSIVMGPEVVYWNIWELEKLTVLAHCYKNERAPVFCCYVYRLNSIFVSEKESTLFNFKSRHL